MYTRYKHLAIEQSDGPPTHSELEAIERALNAKLPFEFVEFLNAANGGYLEYLVKVPLTPPDEEMCFCTIYSTRVRQPSGGFDTFLGEIENERQSKQIPHQVLPFARSGGESLLYLDLTPTGRGRVIAFVDGLPAWTGLRQENTFVELASSFSEFVEMLHIDVEENRFLLEKAIIEQNQENIQAIIEFLDIGLPDWRIAMGYSS